MSLEILLKNNVLFVYLLILNCSLILYNFINNFGKCNTKQTNRNNNQKKKTQKNTQVIEEPRTTKRALIKKKFF